MEIQTVLTVICHYIDIALRCGFQDSTQQSKLSVRHLVKHFPKRLEIFKQAM